MKPGDIATVDLGDELLQFLQLETDESRSQHFLHAEREIFSGQLLEAAEANGFRNVRQVNIPPPIGQQINLVVAS